MASLQDHSQPTSSEGKSNGHLSPICIQTNVTWFIDLLIGTLLFQISVISSLASSEMSRKETEVSPLFQSRRLLDSRRYRIIATMLFKRLIGREQRDLSKSPKTRKQLSEKRAVPGTS
ncbi:uncharacterized protein N7529_001977 [Penicillium soppii]|uniref:uncharacterized protein n=1 Tax=Penicillium soppii TaxID=69789 RepID=UPI0025491C8D|nr:uncharacterized protein N7529_001977 [Penicillium soppii]KAJ5876393.1 hypothetical protein N7529_001977 [Penicillium soppii]